MTNVNATVDLTETSISSNIASGLTLLEDAITFFETVEAGKYSHLTKLLDVALHIAKLL